MEHESVISLEKALGNVDYILFIMLTLLCCRKIDA